MESTPSSDIEAYCAHVLAFLAKWLRRKQRWNRYNLDVYVHIVGRSVDFR